MPPASIRGVVSGAMRRAISARAASAFLELAATPAVYTV